MASGTMTNGGNPGRERATFARADPGWGRSSRLMLTDWAAARWIGLPTIIQYAAAGWLPDVCRTERTMVYLSATRAMWGMCSLMRTPGTLVAAGRKVPRIS